MILMPRCQRCAQIYRVRRNLWQRLFYRAIYECAECSSRIVEPRLYTYRFSSRVRCPECGTYDLRRLSTPDPIDRVSAHPINLLQRLLGGRLNYCSRCRLQFHDWRPMAHKPSASRHAAGEGHLQGTA
jgi:DNA-directed RNA polymerase subunit RPC12/RpoP